MNPATLLTATLAGVVADPENCVVDGYHRARALLDTIPGGKDLTPREVDLVILFMAENPRLRVTGIVALDGRPCLTVERVESGPITFRNGSQIACSSDYSEPKQCADEYPDLAAHHAERSFWRGTAARHTKRPQVWHQHGTPRKPLHRRPARRTSGR